MVFIAFWVRWVSDFYAYRKHIFYFFVILLFTILIETMLYITIRLPVFIFTYEVTDQMDIN